jgi:diacylglycerol kinase family enzyme
MNIVVVHNAKSGNASKLDEIKRAFAEHNIKPRYVLVSDPRLGTKVRKAAAEAGTVIVAAGGDGTVNCVAQAVLGTKAKLGVVPVGTLNHFAKALGMPLEIAAAVGVIVRGRSKSVDVGTVNKQVFVNNSSIGFYPRSLLTRGAYDERIGKWPAAAWGFARALMRPRHYRIDIVIDGVKQTLRTPFVFVGNNEYQRTQPNLGERTTLSSGQLAVYVIKATTPVGIIRSFAHALLTRKRDTEDFAVYLTSNCTIYTRHHRHIHVACDGEVLKTETPLRYRSEHKKLTVIAPVNT